MREGAIKEAPIEFIADPRTALCPITNSSSWQAVINPLDWIEQSKPVGPCEEEGIEIILPSENTFFRGEERNRSPLSASRFQSHLSYSSSNLNYPRDERTSLPFPKWYFCTTIANMRNISKWRISECIWETKNRPIFESSSVAFLISRRRFKSKGAKESSPSLFNDVRFFPSFVELVHWALSWTNNVHLSRRRIEITHFSTENVENCLL